MPTGATDWGPSLSLILCSRNDAYMGNSLWRLQTTLNHVADEVKRLGREKDVEVVVTDWGSEVPLRDVLAISSTAAQMTSFITVPGGLAQELQRDSPFAEVIALNVAAKRARGSYIGRIDQDTLVGEPFLRTFFELLEGRSHFAVPMNTALLFANLRMVPYRLSVRCPDRATIERFLRWFGACLSPENARSRSAFYILAVGIWLLHRDLWNECGGYDERMIYMNGMETNMIRRLQRKYQVVDLGRMTGPEFFHLEHYHPWAARKSSTHRKVNPHLPFSQPDSMNPNGDGWGLAGWELQIEPTSRIAPIADQPGSRAAALTSFATIAATSLQVCADTVGIGVRDWKAMWSTRGSLAWNALRGERPVQWPRVLWNMWHKRSVRSR